MPVWMLVPAPAQMVRGWVHALVSNLASVGWSLLSAEHGEGRLNEERVGAPPWLIGPLIQACGWSQNLCGGGTAAAKPPCHQIFLPWKQDVCSHSMLKKRSLSTGQLSPSSHPQKLSQDCLESTSYTQGCIWRGNLLNRVTLRLARKEDHAVVY